jgi:hypothetical protein
MPSVWEHFVSITWIFFMFAWTIRYASWALVAGVYWINIAFGGSPEQRENNN